MSSLGAKQKGVTDFNDNTYLDGIFVRVKNMGMKLC